MVSDQTFMLKIIGIIFKKKVFYAMRTKMMDFPCHENKNVMEIFIQAS